MNWQYLFYSLFGIAIFALVVTTILFYIHHHVVKRQKARKMERHPTEGRYFSRFVPYQLKDKYSALIQGFESQGQRDKKFVTYATFSSVILVALMLLVAFVYTQRDRFIQRIDLTTQEMSLLPEDQHLLLEEVDRSLPDLGALLPDLRKLQFVFLSHRDDEKWTLGENQRHPSLEYRQVWTEWLQSFGLRHRSCHFDNFNSCLNQPSLILVLPGRWDNQVLDQLVRRGFRILLLGPPSQTFADARSEGWRWRDLRFEVFQHNQGQHILIRADQPLTLGFDAGLQIQAPPLYTEYRALSPQPAGISTASNGLLLGGTFETRLYGEVTGEARIVWSDHVPLLNSHNRGISERHLEALNAAVFRFLLRKPYSSLAHWPQGYDFAAYLNIDAMDDLHQTRALRGWLEAETKPVPVTWNLTSDLAQSSRGEARQLAQVGRLVCAGDTALPFPKSGQKDQTLRLARCQKALNQITSQTITGLRPPQGLFTGETLNAALNTQFSFLLHRQNKGRFTPIQLVSKQSGRELTLISSPATSGDILWQEQNLTSSSTTLLFEDEISWLKLLGGVYGFHFSELQVASGQRLSQLKDLVQLLRKQEAWLTTPENLSQWWVVRQKLLRGESIPPLLLNEYQPVRLTVTPSGVIQRSKWQ